MAEVLERIRQAVCDHDDFLLVAHKDADADSLGSVLAFSDYLQREGKRSYPWAPDPLPRGLAYLPGYEAVNQGEAPAEAVAIAFDAGSPSRFGNLRQRIEAAPLTVVIDHHASNEGFGDISLVQPEAAATGVIVFDALRSWGAHVSPEAATNLYAAIFTDTGGFRHDNTTGAVLRLGAELAELGADPAWVALKSYKSRPETTLKLQALAAASASCSMVSGARAFLGLRPKSARASGEAPNVAFTYATYAAIWLRSVDVWAASARIFALVAALLSSTAARRSMSVCRNASTWTGVYVLFPNVIELTVEKCFWVPATSCVARATSVFFPVVMFTLSSFLGLFRRP